MTSPWSRRETLIPTLLLSGWLALSAPAAAQQSNGATSSVASYRVLRVPGDIRLDAHLSEPAWLTADSIVDFRQREPVEGAPASERTVVKVLRDADRIYVA